MTPSERRPRRAAHRATARPDSRARPTLAERKAAALERRRRAARRRGAVLLLVVVVLAGAAIAACTAVRDGGRTSYTTGGSTTSTTAAARPSAYEVGIETFDWVDHSRVTLNPADPGGPGTAGRVLTTQIRYPTVRGSATGETPGAAPATADGPFPVVLFAHGYDLSPSYYEALLDAWVRAGFIVVSPVFPDENTATVNADGGPYSTEGIDAQYDVENEPGDLAYVLGQFDSLVAKGSGSRLSGMAETSAVVLAGQSDGANVVGALEFGSAFAAVRAALPVVPKAVAILSGQELIPYTGGVNTYAATASSPPVLQVQSLADTCNGTSEALDLFSRLTADPTHLLMVLDGATHLDPYTGVPPWAALVEQATTHFFELETGWRSTGLTLSSIESAASVDGTSSFTTVATAQPTAATEGNCAGQLPVTTGTQVTG